MAIETSTFYKEAIKAPIENVTPEATMGFDPPGSTEGSTIATSNADALCLPEQLTNTNFSMDGKWITTEKYRYRLDGSCVALTTGEDKQVGFFSTDVCDDDGVFPDGVYAEYTMPELFDLIGFTIAFDDLGGEHATEFEVVYLDEDGDELQSETVENDDDTAIVDYRCDGVKKIRINITKWNTPNALAKVAQIFPGFTYIFSERGLYSLSTTDTASLFSSSMTMPDFKLTFDNEDGEFNIINPTGIIQFLREKMRVNGKYSLTVDTLTEKVTIGNYYVYEWPESSNDSTASLTCRPYITFLDDYYEVDATTATATAQEICEVLFDGVPESFELPDSVASVQLNKYIGAETTKLVALQELAIALCGFWKFDKNGGYIFEVFDSEKEISNTLSYSELWSKPTITQTTEISKVDCGYYTYNSSYEYMERTSYVVNPNDATSNQGTLSSTFIGTETLAETVGLSYLAYKAYRLSITISYRGDMSIEVGDMISVETDYGYQKVFVTGHDLSYTESSKLTGSIKGVIIDGGD